MTLGRVLLIVPSDMNAAIRITELMHHATPCVKTTPFKKFVRITANWIFSVFLSQWTHVAGESDNVPAPTNVLTVQAISKVH